MQLMLKEVRGVCRWCRCTHRDPCVAGCGWANRRQTLCTECVEFDRLMRSTAGRRDAIEAFNAGQRSQAIV